MFFLLFEFMLGFGYYNVVDYEGFFKYYMFSFVFVLIISRWIGGVFGEEDLSGLGMLY